nr:MAG TPA: Receptor Binding Protein [Caudoviricetes sp.]
MAETSGFFRSVNGDRKYTTDWLSKWVASFIGNGVYNGELAIAAGGGMNVTVPVGKAWVIGYFYRNPAPKTLPIANADGVLHRKDTIVLRWDVNERNITAQVLQGAFASNPVAPEIVRSAEQYDLKIAEVSIPAGTTAITPALITDTRLDTAVCGIVTGVIDQVDTTTFYNQIAADLAQFKSTQQADFEVWFDSIKDILDESTAGNLLNMIDAVSEDLTAHTSDTTAHITAAERTAWNGKAEKTDVAPDAKMVQTQSHPDYHLRVVYDEMGSFYLDAANSIGETVYVKVSDTRNTASVAGAMTVSTAEPTSFIGAGKFWGVY